MRRITLTVSEDEREALLKLAQRERRDLRDQAALLIRCELERRGLLLVDATPTAGASAQPSGVMQNATS